MRTSGNEHLARPTVPDPPLVLRPADAFPIGTDDLWDLVLEEEMEGTLAARAGPEEWLRALRSLLRARAEPGHDD